MTQKEYQLHLHDAISSVKTEPCNNSLLQKLVDRQIYTSIRCRGDDLKKYRHRLIERLINQTMTIDEQIACLANEHLDPSDYEKFQALRANAKKTADDIIADCVADWDAHVTE